MNIFKILQLTGTLAGLLLGLHAHGDAIMDHDAIRLAVTKHLESAIQQRGLEDTRIEIGQLDPRLRLPLCPGELSVDGKDQSMPGNLSVTVQCQTGKKPWKIYVQTVVRAFKPVLVARQLIRRGSYLNTNNVALEKRDITHLNGNYLADMDRIGGTMSRRFIGKGEVIQSQSLMRQKLVKRGDKVILRAQATGITVNMTGKALNDAAAGETVRVKNDSSQRIVEGIAIKQGVVKINL